MIHYKGAGELVNIKKTKVDEWIGKTAGIGSANFGAKAEFTLWIHGNLDFSKHLSDKDGDSYDGEGMKLASLAIMKSDAVGKLGWGSMGHSKTCYFHGCSQKCESKSEPHTGLAAHSAKFT